MRKSNPTISKENGMPLVKQSKPQFSPSNGNGGSSVRKGQRSSTTDLLYQRGKYTNPEDLVALEKRKKHNVPSQSAIPVTKRGQSQSSASSDINSRNAAFQSHPTLIKQTRGQSGIAATTPSNSRNSLVQSTIPSNKHQYKNPSVVVIPKASSFENLNQFKISDREEELDTLDVPEPIETVSSRFDNRSELTSPKNNADEKPHRYSDYKLDLQVSSDLSVLPTIPETPDADNEELIEDKPEVSASPSQNSQRKSSAQSTRIWNTEYEEFHMELNNPAKRFSKPPDEGNDNLFEISLSFNGHSRTPTISDDGMASPCEATEDYKSVIDESVETSDRPSSNMHDSSLTSATSPASTSTGEDIIAELERLKLQLAHLHVNYNLAIEELGFPKSTVEAHERDSTKTKIVLASADLRYRKYSKEDIENATKSFSSSLKLGDGKFGSVYKGTLDHTMVAIKVLGDVDKGWDYFQREVEMLWHIRHPNVLMLLGACPELGCIVYEFMANGSLQDRLSCKGSTPPLPWFLRFRIAWEMAAGLFFLHSNKPEPIVHRDLKPSHILLDQNFVSKVSSVALARLIAPNGFNNASQVRNTSIQGTFSYIDPEYQRTGTVGTKSDLYAYGIIVLQLLTAKSPDGAVQSVERALKRGNFGDILDPRIKEWPVVEAMRLAKLGLRCCALRRKDRPDLGSVILPELQALKTFADMHVQMRKLDKGKSLSKLSNWFSKKTHTKKVTSTKTS